MSAHPDVAQVARAFEALLRREALLMRWRDPGGVEIALSPSLAASPAGLLPALIVAGEAVWRGATGRGFELEVRRDVDALLGWRLESIGAGGFATVMLASMEAISQAARHGVLHGHELGPVWSDAVRRAQALTPVQPPAGGPTP